MNGCVYKTPDGQCEKFSDGEVRSWCVDGPCEYAVPSNADRIRGMTDEELAVLCEDGCPPGAPICNSVETIEGETVKEHCQRCWLSWLKAPVEVDDE